MFTARALDAAHREHALDALKAAWERVRPDEATRACVEIAPNVAKVAEPLADTSSLADRNGLRALELLQSQTAPISLADLTEHGVRSAAQTIYELQLAGYRIDRLPTGYALWPEDEQPTI